MMITIIASALTINMVRMYTVPNLVFTYPIIAIACDAYIATLIIEFMG